MGMPFAAWLWTVLWLAPARATPTLRPAGPVGSGTGGVTAPLQVPDSSSDGGTLLPVGTGASLELPTGIIPGPLMPSPAPQVAAVSGAGMIPGIPVSERIPVPIEPRSQVESGGSAGVSAQAPLIGEVQVFVAPKAQRPAPPEEERALGEERTREIQAGLQDPFSSPAYQTPGPHDTIAMEPPPETSYDPASDPPPPTMRKTAEAVLRRLDEGARVTGEEARRISRVLEIGNWEAPILADPERSVHVALAAYRRGLISAEQFGTVALRWEAFRDFEPPPQSRAALPWLEGGRLTPAARALLAGRGPTGLDAKQLTRLEWLLQSLPESERQYWTLDARPALDKGDSRYGAPWADGYMSLDVYLFRKIFQFPDFEVRPLIVPSFGFLQAWLQARFGGDAMRLVPEVGLADEDGMTALMGARAKPIALHFPGREEDFYADGFRLNSFLVSMHDIFHAFVGSHYPAAYQRIVSRALAASFQYRRALRAGEAPLRLPDGRELRPEFGYWDRITAKMFDMSLPSFQWFKNTRLGRGALGQVIVQDMGPLETSVLTAILVRDMALHPEAWIGINVPDLLEGIPGSRPIYEAALGEARPPQTWWRRWWAFLRGRSG